MIHNFWFWVIFIHSLSYLQNMNYNVYQTHKEIEDCVEWFLRSQFIFSIFIGNSLFRKRKKILHRCFKRSRNFIQFVAGFCYWFVYIIQKKTKPKLRYAHIVIVLRQNISGSIKWFGVTKCIAVHILCLILIIYIYLFD